MKITSWLFVIVVWIVAVIVAVAILTGVAEGNNGAIALVICGFAYALHRVRARADILQRRIERLEEEMGKHQRFHGHFTNY